MPSSSSRKAAVFHFVPTATKPLTLNSYKVVFKLKKVLASAQAGGIVGALIVTVDKNGYWSTDLAGQMMYDRDLLSQIGDRLLNIHMAPE